MQNKSWTILTAVLLRWKQQLETLPGSGNMWKYRLVWGSVSESICTSVHCVTLDFASGASVLESYSNDVYYVRWDVSTLPVGRNFVSVVGVLFPMLHSVAYPCQCTHRWRKRVHLVSAWLQVPRSLWCMTRAMGAMQNWDHKYELKVVLSRIGL